jgi:TonB family protein
MVNPARIARGSQLIGMRARAAQIMAAAIGATALGTMMAAGEQRSTRWQTALDLARAVAIKSDHVVVDAAELEAAGVDPGAFTPPRRVKGSSPKYPEAAARDNAQGTVLIECVITEAGAVRGCRVTRSVHPAVDREAVKAIQRWEYEPARVTGQARSIVAEFRMIFRLE